MVATADNLPYEGRNPMRIAATTVLLRSLIAVVTWAAPAAAAAVQTWAVTDVRVFDGEAVLERATVVVEDGRIAAVGPGVAVPPNARTIDGQGRTLLPGLIDAHGHSFGDALHRAVVFGATTVLDMFTDPDFAAEQRSQQQAGAAADRADLFSAGVLATAPGGHGTQYGMPIPTLEAPEDAAAWVAARVAEGSDFIKIVVEDGAMLGRTTPTLDLPTVQALVAAAREHGKLAVAHATTVASARLALAAGVDGLVHIFADSAPPADFVAQAAAQGAFVAPTLTVLESVTGRPADADLVGDPHIGPLLDGRERSQLGASFPLAAAGGTRFDNALQAVRALHHAGVAILAGTDAPNPGTAHGASMHREFDLLSAAGLSPAAVLASATSVPADAFGLADRGRIATGLRADLVLVEGNPLEDVRAARAIVGVWKGGHPIDRSPPPATDHAPATLGTLADFDDGRLSAAYGAGWQRSTDDITGGNSTVATRVGDGGAAGTPHYLAVEGRIGDAFAFPWAGAMFFPGDAEMAPVDFSAARELVFWARGEPATYRVMMFSESLGPVPVQVTFEVTEDWTEIVLPLAAFSGLDASGLTAVLWSGGLAQGAFRFDIDQVEFR